MLLTRLNFWFPAPENLGLWQLNDLKINLIQRFDVAIDAVVNSFSCYNDVIIKWHFYTFFIGVE